MGLCWHFYGVYSREANHKFTKTLTLQWALGVHLWNLIYKERKNNYDLKQLKTGKYHPQVKLVCWDFFLTLLNLISLFPLNLIMFPNLRRLAVDGAAVEQNLCDVNNLFSTTKLPYSSACL